MGTQMRVLADTSIWIDFLAGGNAGMGSLLQEEAVDMHPFVIGELACGTLKDRPKFLAKLNILPRVPMATQPEAMNFLETHRLWGLGLNWVDLHLLASSRLGGALLWTRDKALLGAAEKLRLAFFG